MVQVRSRAKSASRPSMPLPVCAGSSAAITRMEKGTIEPACGGVAHDVQRFTGGRARSIPERPALQLSCSAPGRCLFFFRGTQVCARAVRETVRRPRRWQIMVRFTGAARVELRVGFVAEAGTVERLDRLDLRRRLGVAPQFPQRNGAAQHGLEDGGEEAALDVGVVVL